MGKLLKTDCYALFKNKLTYVLLGICVGMALLVVGTSFLSNTVLKSLLEIEDDALLLEAGLLRTGRTVMFGAFSLTNNMGLIIPIFAGIIIMSDLRSGTIRNKVIFGNNRLQIYFSHLIVSTLLCVGAILVTFVIQSIGAALLFQYGAPFDADTVADFARCLTVGLLTFVFVASLTTFLALATKSTPLTIILTLASCLGLGILCSLLSALLTGLKTAGMFGGLPEGILTTMLVDGWFDILVEPVPGYATATVASAGTLTVREFLFGSGSLLLLIAAHTLAGALLFRKADLK